MISTRTKIRTPHHANALAIDSPHSQLLILETGIGDKDLNYFYMGKARAASQSSIRSNIVGDHDLAYSGFMPLIGSINR